MLVGLKIRCMIIDHVKEKWTIGTCVRIFYDEVDWGSPETMKMLSMSILQNHDINLKRKKF